MSIHKSKGLEFPIVFVAGTGKKFNMQDLNGSILLHQDLGLGPKVVDHEKRIYYPSLCQEALKSKIRLETLSEEMRILYVAFTRAKEKLIITGTVKNIEKTVLNWMGILSQQEIKLPSYEISKGKNYLDWIAMSLIRHKDGEALRAIAGIAENHQYHLLEHNSKWSIKVWNKNSLFGKQDESEAIDIESSEENAAVEHSPYRDEIHRRLSWRYLYELASKVPSKISVTELKHYFNTEVSDEYGVPIFIPHLMPKPKFMEEKTKLTGAERGSILHFVMQHLDLAHVTTSEAIQEQLVRMIANELITEQQAQTVQINKIVRFFKSPFGQRMLKSTEIKREVPFYIELNCSELYKDMQDDPYCKETVLLQGVIDCYFQEPDGLVLLDYKTDYIPGGNVNIIKERYQIQLDYYEIALKKITGKAVKEKYIYLFSNEQILKI